MLGFAGRDALDPIDLPDVRPARWVIVGWVVWVGRVGVKGMRVGRDWK